MSRFIFYKITLSKQKDM
ncbi:hypothetical protein MRY26_09715 [Escherichia coli]|nr:hypothetical protein [Escherichia coli]